MFKSTYPSLAEHYIGGRFSDRGLSFLCYGGIALLGSLLLWVSAKVQVPFWPVPMTMQTFAVLAIGMACGWRLAMATVALYLVEGALGLPVFAGTPERGLGLAYMVGPTGGYLLGFLASAGLCGFLAERGFDRYFLGSLLMVFLGLAVIYGFGLLWLSNFVDWSKVFIFGFYPFILGDIVKGLLCALLLPFLWKRA